MTATLLPIAYVFSVVAAFAAFGMEIFGLRSDRSDEMKRYMIKQTFRSDRS